MKHTFLEFVDESLPCGCYSGRSRSYSCPFFGEKMHCDDDDCKSSASGETQSNFSSESPLETSSFDASSDSDLDRLTDSWGHQSEDTVDTLSTAVTQLVKWQWVVVQPAVVVMQAGESQLVVPAPPRIASSEVGQSQSIKGSTKGSTSKKTKTIAKVKGEQVVCDARTTVMMQNLPRQMTRDGLLRLLEDHGFKDLCSFVYVPVDLTRQTSLGYAFVDLSTPEVVPLFWTVFDGFKDWHVACDKACRVSWSNPHQGLEQHIERYRNSPLMHTSVPDDARPILIQRGVRVEFPAPTKSIRAPRLRPPRGGKDRRNGAVM